MSWFLSVLQTGSQKKIPPLVQKPDSILRFQKYLLIFLSPWKKVQKISFYFSFLGPRFPEKCHPFPLEFIIHNDGYPRDDHPGRYGASIQHHPDLARVRLTRISNRRCKKVVSIWWQIWGTVCFNPICAYFCNTV